jgi:TatD DNase family protein
MIFADTHCHLDFPQFDPDRETVIKNSFDGGIKYLINIGSSLKSSLASVALAQQYDFVYAAVGIHPHEADIFQKKDEETLRKLASSKKVVAIGEIGLDYFKNFSKAENQRPLFIALVKMAKEFNLPLVIHSRDAHADTLRILKDAMPLRAVVHCFSGGRDFLQECLELGFYISFTCNITYKKADNLRLLVKETPLERVLLETDAPYLAPEGLRGKRNEPIHVKTLAEEIAKLKETNIEDIANITTNNAKSFFNLQ